MHMKETSTTNVKKMSTIEEGIKTFFKELDENSKIIKYEQVTAEDNFTVLLRTKLTNSDTWGKVCNDWVEQFTTLTNSKYIVKSSYPQPQRMDFRKVYVCKVNRGKNSQACRSKIDIKIKKVTKDTLKKDHLLRSGYNGIIQVLFAHSHQR